MPTLFVHYEEGLVGQLHVDDEGVYSFTYDQAWLDSSHAIALSFALPLRTGSFSHRKTLSFFENLLPEGDVLLDIERSRGIQGVFPFLREYGKDCAGAFTITSSPNEANDDANDLVELPWEQLDEVLEGHRSVAQVIANREPGYLSLAGAQDKFAAIYKNQKLFLPRQSCPTTHIVKTPIWRRGIKESVYNEYFCMSLAANLGFRVPKFSVLKRKHPLFIVERYDRTESENGNVTRLHQQDFCQAQGFTSGQKYEVTGGPTILDNYELIKKFISGDLRYKSLEEFLRWVCFNLLIGNNDSHSKNISLLMSTKVELAPFYDLICTEIYPNLQSRFSFSIGGENAPDKIGLKQFRKLESSLDLKVGTFLELFHEMIHQIENVYQDLAENVQSEFAECKVTTRISSLIERRLKGFRKRINAS